MKKLHFMLGLFALALAATNWTSSKVYDREFGITEQSISPAALGVIFSAGAVWFLGRRAYQTFREILGKGIKIEKGKRFVSFWPVLYLCPLLLRFHTTSSSVLDDGTLVTRAYGYGSELGPALFILGAVSFILMQLIVEMELARKSEGVQGVEDDAGQPPRSSQPDLRRASPQP